MPWHGRAWRIARTAVRANVLGSAADCTVTTIIDTYRCGIRCRRTSGLRLACANLPLRCCVRLYLTPSLTCDGKR